MSYISLCNQRYYHKRSKKVQQKNTKWDMIYLCFQLRHFFIHKYFMAYMANIKTLSVFSVNDFLDRKILDKCLIASVMLLNGKNSWQTHCMEFCRGQIRERNVIRLGRAGIGRDRAYFSSFVLRSVTVSSRISLSFNLVSRLILHRLQGPGGHTQLGWNICWKHLQCVFLLSPQENKYSAIQIVVIDVVDCN